MPWKEIEKRRTPKTTEYKVRFDGTGDKLEIEVVGFLNALGGTIYYGIDDDGKIAGVDNSDELQQVITNRITDKIKPNTLGLVDIFAKQDNGETIVGVSVSSGLDTPYYFAKCAAAWDDPEPVK
jgi:predicted HTH transcriptional regulator